jgi:hypothetical protein
MKKILKNKNKQKMKTPIYNAYKTLDECKEFLKNYTEITDVTTILDLIDFDGKFHAEYEHNGNSFNFRKFEISPQPQYFKTKDFFGLSTTMVKNPDYIIENIVFISSEMMLFFVLTPEIINHTGPSKRGREARKALLNHEEQPKMMVNKALLFEK